MTMTNLDKDNDGKVNLQGFLDVGGIIAEFTLLDTDGSGGITPAGRARSIPDASQ